MPDRIVLVCGGRNYNDRAHTFLTLDRMHKERPITKVIHGAARGADTLGGDWARARRIPVQAFPAQWNTEGRAAGPKRNQRMLDQGHPTEVLAFPGGTGTADMKRRARTAGVPVLDA